MPWLPYRFMHNFSVPVASLRAHPFRLLLAIMATKAPDVDLTETKQPVLYAAVITTYGLAVIAVLLRFLARRLRRLDWWLDDWLILVALVRPSGRAQAWLLVDISTRLLLRPSSLRLLCVRILPRSNAKNQEHERAHV